MSADIKCLLHIHGAAGKMRITLKKKIISSKKQKNYLLMKKILLSSKKLHNWTKPSIHLKSVMTRRLRNPALDIFDNNFKTVHNTFDIVLQFGNEEVVVGLSVIS